MCMAIIIGCSHTHIHTARRGGVVCGAVAHSSEVGESGEGNISVGVRGRSHQGDENQGECLKTTTPMLLNAPNNNCITVP